MVSPDDARRALAELRRRHREIAPHVPSIKIVYEGAVKTIEDPAARVAELRYVRPHSNLAWLRCGNYQRQAHPIKEGQDAIAAIVKAEIAKHYFSL